MVRDSKAATAASSLSGSEGAGALTEVAPPSTLLPFRRHPDQAGSETGEATEAQLQPAPWHVTAAFLAASKFGRRLAAAIERQFFGRWLDESIKVTFRSCAC